LNSLAAFLLKLNPKNASALQNAPDFATAGALVYEAHRCGECHAVNGVGEDVGPTLNGLSSRRSRSWVIQHFVEPSKLSPGTRMKPYQMSARDMQNLTTYLFALPEL
jgi:ubiquinol-cytochrome c reductase cytochrome b subunit